MFANSFLQSFLQSCGLANFLQGINRSIIWRLNHGVSKRLQLLEVGVQRSFVPREEFLGRPFDKTSGGYLGHLKPFFGATKGMDGCPLIGTQGSCCQKPIWRTSFYEYQIPTHFNLFYLPCRLLHLHPMLYQLQFL